jgi:hypothetical protein
MVHGQENIKFVEGELNMIYRLNPTTNFEPVGGLQKHDKLIER